MAKSSKLSDDNEKSRVGLGGFTKDLKGTLKKSQHIGWWWIMVVNSG